MADAVDLESSNRTPDAFRPRRLEPHAAKPRVAGTVLGLPTEYLPEGTELPNGWDDVPLSALMPAFMLSELKTAFLIGFRVYLPFLVLDILVASVTVSMGMFMLPPAYVSLPFKLLLFVMVDGWHLLVEMLLKSFVP